MKLSDALAFVVGFLLCAGAAVAVSCSSEMRAGLGDVAADPHPQVSQASADAQRVVAAAEARAADAERARVAAEARANDATATAEERAKAADEAKAALVERDRAAQTAKDMAALQKEITEVSGKVSTIQNLPLPKGFSTSELLAWLTGSGGIAVWLARLLGPNRKHLEDLLAKAKAMTQEWDRTTPMTAEDARELAPHLAALGWKAPG